MAKESKTVKEIEEMKKKLQVGEEIPLIQSKKKKETQLEMP